MTEKVITCINCPMGCRMSVQMEGDEIRSISGNTCKRGETYARQECVEPMRMVTAVVPVENSKMPVSVKTRTPIPKARIAQCMEALSALSLRAPIHEKDVVLADVCGTGVDVIATRSIAG